MPAALLHPDSDIVVSQSSKIVHLTSSIQLYSTRDANLAKQIADKVRETLSIPEGPEAYLEKMYSKGKNVNVHVKIADFSEQILKPRSPL